MANTTSRGGMKQGRAAEGKKKHQGVRPGSTATVNQRHQIENRKPVIDEAKERRLAKRRSTRSEPSEGGQGPGAKKAREQAPQRKGRIKAGTGKKNLYANMPKGRKVR